MYWNVGICGCRPLLLFIHVLCFFQKKIDFRESKPKTLSMKLRLLKAYAFVPLCLLLSAAIFYGCSKSHDAANPQQQTQQQSFAIVQQSPSKIPVSTILDLRNGDHIVYAPGQKPAGFSNIDARVNGCGVDPWFTPPSIYRGFTAYLSGCPSDPSTTITLSFSIETHAEYNLVPTSATKGRLKLVGGFPYPTTTKTAPLTATYSSSYYNSFGEEVNIFYLTFSITLSVSEYCNYNEISVGATGIPTDCDDVVVHTVDNATDYFTPQTYKVYPYFANSTSAGQMTAFPAITLCQNCHDPALGASPTHTFEYRLQGTSSWTAVVYNDLNSHTITVSAGTYEYRSKGKLKTDGTYSSYTAIGTVVVP